MFVGYDTWMQEGLDLVRRFVNTFDPDTAADDLATPQTLVTWLAERDLVDSTERPSASAGDVRNARAVREALRDLLVVNAGGPEAPAASETLDRQARRSRVLLGFRPHGGALEAQAGGVDGALGRLLAAVADAMADGSWGRLKACLAEDCRWAFLDRSRNCSRRWCDMSVCGNREKARVFRARHARQ